MCVTSPSERRERERAVDVIACAADNKTDHAENRLIPVPGWLTGASLRNRLLTHLGTGNGAERRELFTQFLIIDGVIKILYIQVYTL